MSDDSKIYALFLSANVTALIQPMDQGIIETVKKKYKKKLLQRLIIEDDCGTSIADFVKGINLKVVADLIHKSWDEISKETLRKSWRKILPIIGSLCTSSGVSPPTLLLAELYQLVDNNDENDEVELSFASCTHGCGAWHGLRFRVCLEESSASKNDDVSIGMFHCLFEELRMKIECNEIVQWLENDTNDSGIQLYSDAEICDIVSRSVEIHPEEEKEREEVDDEEPCSISNSEAAYMFERCLLWLEHQPEATVYNSMTLRDLKTMASKKRMKSLK